MNWLPNPYALAQVLADELDLESLYSANGDAADQLLSKAFQSQDKGKTLADVLGLFHQLAEAVKRPMSIEEVMNLAQAKRAVEAFDLETIRLLLPYLVPILDAEFAPSGGGGPSGSSVPSWFADSGQLMIDNASYLDPIQGAVGNCYLISAMISLAWCKLALWQARMGSAGFDPPTERSFQWQFHNGEGAKQGLVKVSGRIPIAGKKTPRYAKSLSGESWPGLVEKAYVVKARPAGPSSVEPTPADYQMIDRNAPPQGIDRNATPQGIDLNTTPQGACQSLVGGKKDGLILDFEEGRKIFTREGKLGTRAGGMSSSGVISKPAMAWTRSDIGVTDSKIWEKTGLWPSHAYAVLGVMGDPDRLEHVVLRNPHGVATETRDGYAKGIWNAGERPVELNQHGVFAITPELFYKHFGDIGWVDVVQTA